MGEWRKEPRATLGRTTMVFVEKPLNADPEKTDHAGTVLVPSFPADPVNRDHFLMGTAATGFQNVGRPEAGEQNEARSPGGLLPLRLGSSCFVYQVAVLKIL